MRQQQEEEEQDVAFVYEVPCHARREWGAAQYAAEAIGLGFAPDSARATRSTSRALACSRGSEAMQAETAGTLGWLAS